MANLTEGLGLLANFLNLLVDGFNKFILNGIETKFNLVYETYHNALELSASNGGIYGGIHGG
jgi:hypothetical protein